MTAVGGRAIGGLALQTVEHIDIKCEFFLARTRKKPVPRVSRNRAVERCVGGVVEIWLTVCKIGLEQTTQFPNIPQNGIGEFAAGEVAVCGHGMAEARFAEGWGGLIEESALLDCLEVFGSTGSVGLA